MYQREFISCCFVLFPVYLSDEIVNIILGSWRSCSEWVVVWDTPLWGEPDGSFVFGSGLYAFFGAKSGSSRRKVGMEVSSGFCLRSFESSISSSSGPCLIVLTIHPIFSIHKWNWVGSLSESHVRVLTLNLSRSVMISFGSDLRRTPDQFSYCGWWCW